jgi:hypothetical protein
MALVIRPAYGEVQAAMVKPPADRREWAALYQKVARLAEFENLLFFRSAIRRLVGGKRRSFGRDPLIPLISDP